MTVGEIILAIGSIAVAVTSFVIGLGLHYRAESEADELVKARTNFASNVIGQIPLIVILMMTLQEFESWTLLFSGLLAIVFCLHTLKFLQERKKLLSQNA